MADKIDLLKIAQEEQNGDLFKCLDGIYKRSKTLPRGCPDAVIWEGGNFTGGVNPVAHAFTDMFALNGTIMALDVLGLPFLGVPMMAQYRHDTKLKPLEWFGKMDYTCLKWSTAGDFMVNDGGKKVVVAGKSGTAEFGLPDDQGRLPFHSWFVAFVPKDPTVKAADPGGLRAVDRTDSELAVLAFAYDSRTKGNVATEIVKYYLQLHYGIEQDYRIQDLLERGNFYQTN